MEMRLLVNQLERFCSQPWGYRDRLYVGFLLGFALKPGIHCPQSGLNPSFRYRPIL